MFLIHEVIFFVCNVAFFVLIKMILDGKFIPKQDWNLPEQKYEKFTRKK